MNHQIKGSGQQPPNPPTPNQPAGSEGIIMSMDMRISHQCRRASNKAVDKKTMAKDILEVYWNIATPLSAWHIVEITGYDINSVRPRIAELSDSMYCSKHYERQEAFLLQAGKVKHARSRKQLTGYIYNRKENNPAFERGELF